MQVEWRDKQRMAAVGPAAVVAVVVVVAAAAPTFEDAVDDEPWLVDQEAEMS